MTEAYWEGQANQLRRERDEALKKAALLASEARETMGAHPESRIWMIDFEITKPPRISGPFAHKELVIEKAAYDALWRTLRQIADCSDEENAIGLPGHFARLALESMPDAS